MSTSSYNLNSNPLTLFPNPARGNVTIQLLNDSSINSFQIFNLLGEQVLKDTNKNESYNLNISNLSDGIFMIKVKTKQGVFFKKLIVKN